MASSPLYSAVDFDRILPVELGKTEGHEPPWRSPFRRDLARLIHSAAFRRLQGKTQLFAGLESDFFRNRLTHSLEVAQIARTITLKLNHEQFAAHELQIDMDLVELACLAHDLGHPPFGHTGERILDELMKEDGGFEGNAQTCRILCRLEKKLDAPEKQFFQGMPLWFSEGSDVGVGLNLCSRSLAAILKYDSCIPVSRPEDAKLAKGYYFSEAPVVDWVRRRLVLRDKQALRVVECQIMDLADDIAYSTYDIEDAFKSGLLNPLDFLFPEDKIIDETARRVSGELDDHDFSPLRVREVLRKLFATFGQPDQAPDTAWQDWYLSQLGRSYRTARSYAASGFLRTSLTSSLVNRFIHAVKVTIDAEAPAFSVVTMEPAVRAQVSVLKQITYLLLTSSSRMKIVAYRGEGVVRAIFEALANGGEALLPEDFGQKYEQADDVQKRRVICDFIAGMTDRYAVEFYARLSSDDFHTMFKP